MNFMKRVFEDSKEIWQNCADELFLKQMADGSLSKNKFKDYLIQDSLYLRDYLKVFAYAITKSKTIKEMQLFYSLLGFVNDGENVTRLNYLKEFGMTDADIEKQAKRKECAAYCNFLLETAKNGDIPELLMAMLPCMAGYNDVFETLKKRAPQVTKGYYAPFIADYTSDFYRESCKFWIDYAEDVCQNLNMARKNDLLKLFRQASLHELSFWKMAGEEKENNQ